MERLLRCCVLWVAIVLSACDGGTAASADKSGKVVPGEPDAEPTAAAPAVTRVAMSLPERFDAPLPASSQKLAAWRDGDVAFPPEAFVADLLAAGDAAMFERLAAAASKVRGDDAAAWARGWHERLHYRDLAAAFCAATQPVLDAPPSTLRMALAGPFAQRCAGADARAAILRADTPDWAVVAWYSDRHGTPQRGPMPYDARLAEALRTALAQPKGTDAFAAASALASHPDPAAAEAMLAIHASIADADLADRIAHTMRWSRDARVHAIGVAACRRRSPGDADCDRVFGDGAAAPKVPTSTDPALTTLAAALNALGFTRVDPAHPPEGGDAGNMLVEAGHAYWFDVETGTFPNGHDSLLRALADLTQPTLAGVVFEEVAPEYDEAADANDADGIYLLRAYVDGQLLETQAEDLGDWYDVDAVLRLLDAVLLERQAAARFLLLETTDQTAIIVAADGAVLEAAIRARLLTPGDPNAAEALGKGFEQRVLRSLQQGDAG